MSHWKVGPKGSPGRTTKDTWREGEGYSSATGWIVCKMFHVPGQSMISLIFHQPSPIHSLVPSLTVLPGGCPACDTRALQEALLCLEHRYAAFPLPSMSSFNGSHTLLENAADIGGVAIAFQVCWGPCPSTFLPLSLMEIWLHSFLPFTFPLNRWQLGTPFLLCRSPTF